MQDKSATCQMEQKSTLGSYHDELEDSKQKLAHRAAIADIGWRCPLPSQSYPVPPHNCHLRYVFGYVNMFCFWEVIYQRRKAKC